MIVQVRIDVPGLYGVAEVAVANVEGLWMVYFRGVGGEDWITADAGIVEYADGVYADLKYLVEWFNRFKPDRPNVRTLLEAAARKLRDPK